MIELILQGNDLKEEVQDDIAWQLAEQMLESGKYSDEIEEHATIQDGQDDFIVDEDMAMMYLYNKATKKLQSESINLIIEE